MAFNVAEPIKPTLLSLAYYAKIMGINPVHFQGATGDTVFPTGRCSDVWPRYTWQDPDKLSHEELARAIYDAEEDIARELGYYPAPMWIAQEQHRFPRYHRRDVWRLGGRNVRGARVSLATRWGKFIEQGQRALTLVGTATVAGGSLVYSDEDSDGFSETATITLATALTDACEIKVYFADQSGDPAWEIRPAKSKTITGGNVVLVFPSWLFIDPDLRSVYPTADSFRAVDISTTANFVTSVDVYREYNDPTETSATFFWEPTPNAGVFCVSCGGTGCIACQLTTQDGCIHVRDVENGIVVPQPATYSADDAAWSQVAYSVCRDPDMVRLYYYAGDQDNRYLSGQSCEALSNYWAHAIAWLATARLDSDPCSCGNVQSLTNHLREDLAKNTEISYQIGFDLLDNPFGTRRGAIQAWQRVYKTQGRRITGGVI